MLRIIHTADWHLGQNFFSYDRTAEHEHFLDWLARELTDRSIDALLIAGDVFDVSNPSATSQRMFYRFLSRVSRENPGLQVIVTAGNHDSASRLEAPMPLVEDLRVTIKGVVRKIAGEIQLDDLVVPIQNKEGEVEAFCLAVPYLRQGDYPAVETEGNAYAEGVRELYRQLIAHTEIKRTSSQALIAMGHLQATGSEIAEKDHSERTIIGGLESISPDVFDGQVAYVALGHIHKAQRVSGREQVRYAGSPLSMSFAEKHYKHGVVCVSIEEGKLKEIEKVEYTPLVSMCSVSATQSASPEEVLEELQNLPEREDSISTAPYLEVKVLLDEPNPMLPQEIRDIVSKKQVRLARITTTFRQGGRSEADEELLTAGLDGMNPLDIIKAAYEKRYNSDIPENLLELFHKTCVSLELIEKEEGNQ
ncbi:exonuclease subunit SbcD [Bacteroides sp. 214]|uniref:exonuclease SbcCD subunit D n=1 Tax=Bacteroides sp. 214 TaxID=2302935 RepID=UPI0013CFDD43|nr:exonuclease SbcCD subunit D C-terminal domain-containing protein [Bacteroides sp. 214]NDW11912.1 exonuclease subunit SbcD [Bacteroides sp. 214]